MDLDIWRYIIHGKGTDSNHKGFLLYVIDDMCRMQLPEHWWYTLNSHGEGKAIVQFKVKPILSWTPTSK
jgi:ATP-dependent Clp protease adapter protein ClpS